MMFPFRPRDLAEVPTAEELARKVTEMTWCECAAFRLAGTPYLFLNDSTHGGGAQEYGVVRQEPDGSFLQIETVTFGWMTEEQVLAFLQELPERTEDAIQIPVEINFDHGRVCRYCA